MPDSLIILLAMLGFIAANAIAWLIRDIITTKKENEEVERWLKQGEKAVPSHPCDHGTWASCPPHGNKGDNHE